MKRNTGPNALRRGRASRHETDYFLTVCTEDRKAAITGSVADTMLAALHESHAAGAWRLRCLVLMPDHLHLLARLGDKLTLSQAVSRFKFATRLILGAYKARWQDNYYDHRLRVAESAEPVIRYIHSNPYEAGLVPAGATWPWFYCALEDWDWFSQLTDSGRPYPEWLR